MSDSKRHQLKHVSGEASRRIAATNHNALMGHRDSKAATGRPPVIPAKAKAAIAVMLEQPERDLVAAA
jgi:hypothetical protein